MQVLNFYKIGQIIPENAKYIGRKNYKLNLPQSIFANPFPLKEGEPRGTTIGKYKKWLWEQLLEEKITKKDILSLEGYDLVCYCAPQACHGDVLKSAYEYIKNNEADFDAKLEKYKIIKQRKQQEEKNNSKFKPSVRQKHTP